MKYVYFWYTFYANFKFLHHGGIERNCIRYKEKFLKNCIDSEHDFSPTIKFEFFYVDRR